jgi:hypothetical protein
MADQPNLPPPQFPTYGEGVPGRPRILDMSQPPPAAEPIETKAEDDRPAEEPNARRLHRRGARSPE